MPTNDFLAIAKSVGANVKTQAEYAALADLLNNGMSSGVVDAKTFNKILRQTTLGVAALAQFVADNQAADVLDDGDVAGLAVKLLRSVRKTAQQTPVLTGGAANAYTAVNPAPLAAGDLVHGATQRVKIHAANTGASTFAPDGLPAKPVYGRSLAAVTAGELLVDSVVTLEYIVQAGVNGGNGAWMVLDASGGALQLPAGTYQAGAAVGAGDASTKLATMAALNGSGRIIQARHYYDAGSITSSTSYVSANGASFNFTPLRADSITVGVMGFHMLQATLNGVNYTASHNVYEAGGGSWVAVDTATLLSYTSGGVSPNGMMASLMFYYDHVDTGTRQYTLRHQVSNASGNVTSRYIRALILEIMP